MKKLLFMGACLLALSSTPVLAQTGGPDVVVMRFDRGGGSAGKLVVSTAFADGKTDQQEMKGSVVEEAACCQRAIAALVRQGYRLQGTFATGFGSTNSLVFIKGQ